MNRNKLVHIIDGARATRRSIAFSLACEGFATRSWASAPAFVDNLDDADRGCILMEVGTPHGEGLRAQRIVSQRADGLPIIAMSASLDVELAVMTIRAGAIDCLARPFALTTLLEAVHFGCGTDPDGAQTRKARAIDRLAALSLRERQVLEGLANGHSNAAIASHLGVSVRIIEIDRAILVAKLSVQSLIDALRIAFAAGMGR